jgi:hypothetical protein
MRKLGMEMSAPDPSSAMIGSVFSHVEDPLALRQAVSEHRHALSAMMTPAAPDR